MRRRSRLKHFGLNDGQIGQTVEVVEDVRPGMLSWPPELSPMPVQPGHRIVATVEWSEPFVETLGKRLFDTLRANDLGDDGSVWAALSPDKRIAYETVATALMSGQK